MSTSIGMGERSPAPSGPALTISPASASCPGEGGNIIIETSAKHSRLINHNHSGVRMNIHDLLKVKWRLEQVQQN